MKFHAEFVSSFSSLAGLPADGRPEVAFIGRSNVGKSSLINSLAERKQLAKTSSTPGKTQLLNFFTVNDQFYLVDMPGYGYAKTSKSLRMDWAKITEEYFTKRKQLCAVGILIDARHPLLESDQMIVEWFSEKNLPFFIVLTKTDKPKQNEVAYHERLLKEQVFSALKILKTSSEKGRGIQELRAFVQEIVTQSATFVA